MSQNKKLVVAIGGNALLKRNEKPDFKTHIKNAKKTSKLISEFAESRKGKSAGIILTHGNGPQVGDELMRNWHAKKYIPDLPLYVLTAETQAYIGSILAYSINPMLSKTNFKGAVAVVTHSLVGKRDPTMKKPSKQIGPYYTKKQLERELKIKKFEYVKENGLYRMIVPSPKPLSILEIGEIDSLVNRGYIPICGGGGGIPVVEEHGIYKGVDAVIDKDETSALIAENIKATDLIILTEADALYSNFSDKNSKIIKITTKEAAKLIPKLEDGTIKPKLDACINFVKSTGNTARIGSLDNAFDVCNGDSGTLIVP